MEKGELFKPEDMEFEKAKGKLPIQDKKRVEGYQKFIASMNIDKKYTSLNKAAIKAQQKDNDEKASVLLNEFIDCTVE